MINSSSWNEILSSESWKKNYAYFPDKFSWAEQAFKSLQDLYEAVEILTKLWILLFCPCLAQILWPAEPKKTS